MNGQVLRVWLSFAGVNGAIAVAAGAYASHGLTDGTAIHLFRTAGEYQLWHALALVGVTALAAQSIRPPPLLALAAWGFLVGLLLFCGSLYAMALTGDARLAQVTPLGGSAFLVGWTGLAAAGVFWRPDRRRWEAPAEGGDDAR